MAALPIRTKRLCQNTHSPPWSVLELEACFIVIDGGTTLMPHPFLIQIKHLDHQLCANYLANLIG
jgi:hypothetical protein